MRSQALCNRAKAYLPNIKAAFEATFQQEVQVQLELATATQVKNNPVKDLPVNNKNSVSPASSQNYEPIAKSVTTNVFNQTQPTTNLRTETIVGEPTVTQSEPTTLNTEAYAPTTSSQSAEDEVAIQRFADFFKGEVVKFTDDLALAQPITENLLPPQPNFQWDDTNAEAEDGDY